MDYHEALRFLYSFVDFERVDRIDRQFDLGSYRAFLERVDNPHRCLPYSVLVAGTKGKGSTVCLLASALKRCGLKVGTYTSPHLISPTERIAIDLNPISREDFARWISYLKPELERSAERGYRTVFETMTTIAFLHFVEQKVDIAVLEVGVGGKLDATNVVEPAVSVITPIGLDHTALLGSTLAEIAEKKSGIIHRHVRVVTAPQAPEAMEVIEEKARLSDALLVKVGHDLRYAVRKTELDGTSFAVNGGPWSGEFRLKLLGRHQAQNAATALASLWQLREMGLQLDGKLVAEGLSSATLQGRFQLLGNGPAFILDGAHNPTSMMALRQTVEDLFKEERLVVVFGMLVHKDIPACLTILAPVTRKLICTRPDFPRASSPEHLVSCARDLGINALQAPDVPSALDLALSISSPEEHILITGSFYLVGEALGLILARGNQ